MVLIVCAAQPSQGIVQGAASTHKIALHFVISATLADQICNPLGSVDDRGGGLYCCLECSTNPTKYIGDSRLDTEGEPSGKRVWLVRHAESQNNDSKNTASRTLLRGRCPSLKQWKIMAPMITFPMDTPLSTKGLEQVTTQAQQIATDEFVTREGVELIVHSHLQRAKDTCMGLFGAYGVPIQEHPRLYEKSLGEHFAHCTGCGADITQRVDDFTSYLQQRAETRIVVVGHSGFFRTLTGQTDRPENVSVWQAILTPEGQYRDIKLVYAGNPPVPNGGDPM